MPNPRHRTVVLLAVLGVLAVVAPASASHTFPDVSSTSAHHDSISAMRSSGITLGCATGRYCPNQNVNRGQMASFLTRAGGHAAGDRSVTTLAPGVGNVNGVPVTVSLRGPGSGGRQNVLLNGAVTVYRNGPVAGCPCEVEAFIYRARDDAQGASSFTTLPAEAAAGGLTSVSLPVSWAVPISGNRAEEYRVAVFVGGTTQAGVRAEGNLTAVTAPFGAVRP